MAPVLLPGNGHVGQFCVEMMCHELGQEVTLALDARVKFAFLQGEAQGMKDVATS